VSDVQLNGDARVLVIDDDPSMVPLIEGLVRKGVSVYGARTLQKGCAIALEQRFDVILLDQMLPDGAGLDCIEKLLSTDRLRPILFVTAQSDASTAIEATRKGAFDYLPKPLDFSFLRQRLLEALEYRNLTRTPVVVDHDSKPTEEILVGRCRLMQDVYKSIGRLSSIRSAVLIEGEPGTGKDLIARSIHQYGETRSWPLEKCIASDIESLLAKLTTDGGASADRTILLEDIDQVSLSAQSRILQVLRDNADTKKVPSRWIFTTSLPSRLLLENGLVRSDLFYLLSSTLVSIPPLRKRDGDLELLISYFLQRASHVRSIQDNRAARVSPEAMLLLKSYAWPGNVAELKSVLDRILLESRGVIQASDTLRELLSLRTQEFPQSQSRQQAVSPSLSGQLLEVGPPFDLLQFAKEQLQDSKTSSLYDDCISRLEATLIPLVLHHTSGNRAAAARILGMTRTSLRKKMVQLGLGGDDSIDEQDTAKEGVTLSGADE
jgi:two-component system nitrogen regulation response regulator GlnG